MNAVNVRLVVATHYISIRQRFLQYNDVTTVALSSTIQEFEMEEFVK